MSFFHWLATGSSHGIYLEQKKEPALSKPALPFYSTATLQSQPFDHGFDLSKPLEASSLHRSWKAAQRKRFRSSVQTLSTTSHMYPARSIPCSTIAGKLYRHSTGWRMPLKQTAALSPYIRICLRWTQKFLPASNRSRCAGCRGAIPWRSALSVTLAVIP